MDNYVCLNCGSEVGAIKGSEMFCTKCKRKMFKVGRINLKVEDILVEGWERSLQEQFELNDKEVMI